MFILVEVGSGGLGAPLGCHLPPPVGLLELGFGISMYSLLPSHQLASGWSPL